MIIRNLLYTFEQQRTTNRLWENKSTGVQITAHWSNSALSGVSVCFIGLSCEYTVYHRLYPPALGPHFVYGFTVMNLYVLAVTVWVRLAVPLLGLPLGWGHALPVLCVISLSPSSVDVQLGQGQCEGQLTSVWIRGTLQDVMHGVPSSRPARSDEVCICGLNIRHCSYIVQSATPCETVQCCEPAWCSGSDFIHRAAPWARQPSNKQFNQAKHDNTHLTRRDYKRVS